MDVITPNAMISFLKNLETLLIKEYDYILTIDQKELQVYKHDILLSEFDEEFNGTGESIVSLSLFSHLIFNCFLVLKKTKWLTSDGFKFRNLNLDLKYFYEENENNEPTNFTHFYSVFDIKFNLKTKKLLPKQTIIVYFYNSKKHVVTLNLETEETLIRSI